MTDSSETTSTIEPAVDGQTAEPFLTDIETQLQLWKNRSLRRAVDAFVSLAEARWTKYAKMDPEEFAKKAMPLLQTIENALVKTNFGEPKTDEEKARVKEEFALYVFGRAHPVWLSKDLVDKDKTFASKADDANALLDADYMHIDERIVRDPEFIQIVECLYSPLRMLARQSFFNLLLFFFQFFCSSEEG